MTVKAIVGICYNTGLEPNTIYTDKLDSESMVEWVMNLRITGP